jgi:SagB-type dehydrogenase family enzyme
MKKILISLLILSTCTLATFAQNSANIQLPAPKKDGGIPIMKALQNRKSSRTFVAGKELTNQQISNLLWAAYGFNRPNKRTAPSATDSQEFTLYVFLKSGIYKWDDSKNILIHIATGDYRTITGKQDFVKDASLNIVFVANYNKLTKYTTDIEKSNMAHINCGYISQNIYLYCASEGLATIVRGWIDKDEIAKKLQLPSYQKVIVAQSVGYDK